MTRKVTRKWELFPGRNKFYCDGRLMSAPNTTVFYLTVFLITITSGLFFAFDCPFLASKITPAIPIVGGVLYVFVMSSLFRTSFSDPGIIPRATADEAADIEKRIEVPNAMNSPTYRPPPRTKEVQVKGQTVKLKYCFTCKLFRPPRASHCSLCDNCVERFDHHCPWVGNCVGKRNYRFFYMFIVSLAFLAVFIFSCAMTHIILLTKGNEPVIVVIKQTPSSVIVATICFFSVWSVIGLAGFHTYLTSSDQTTNEDIKGSFSSKNGQQVTNPYSQSNICLNCFHILCGPMTPSLIDRRGVVSDDDRIQMEYDAKHVSSPQQPTLMVQPLGTGSPAVTPNTNDTYTKYNEVDPKSRNVEFYRQVTFDNLLQNDNKSGSAAHLVDNEIPISSTSMTVKDDTKLFNISHREPHPPPPPPHLPNSTHDELQIHHPASSRSKLIRPTVENMYSNVLPTPIGSSRIQPMPGPLKPLRPVELQSWSEPTPHVYSKIEEKMHESIDIFLKSVPYRRRINDNNSDNGHGETHLDDIEDVDDENDDHDTMMTVSDDNDEEDGINLNQLANSSPPLTDFNHSRASNLSSKMTMSTSSSSAATAATQIDSRNSTTIRPMNPLLTKPVPFQADDAQILVLGKNCKNSNINNNNSIGSSNSISNTSDLDGGSSIGNNSQSCLVKSAIV